MSAYATVLYFCLKILSEEKRDVPKDLQASKHTASFHDDAHTYTDMVYLEFMWKQIGSVLSFYCGVSSGCWKSIL